MTQTLVRNSCACAERLQTGAHVINREQRLTDADLRAKGTQAIEIRDNIESYCQGQQYSTFLNHLVPVFLKILDGNPVFISTSPEQVSAYVATILQPSDSETAHTQLRPRDLAPTADEPDGSDRTACG